MLTIFTAVYTMASSTHVGGTETNIIIVAMVDHGTIKYTKTVTIE